MTTQGSTHWWRFAIVVENDFRNVRGRLEYQWYSQFATNFEAVIVSGPLPRRTTVEDKIAVYLNYQLVGAWRDKAGAVSRVHELLARAPPGCAALIDAYKHVVITPITG